MTRKQQREHALIIFKNCCQIRGQTFDPSSLIYITKDGKHIIKRYVQQKYESQQQNKYEINNTYETIIEFIHNEKNI